MERYAIHCTGWGKSITLSLADLFLEYEEQETKISQVNKEDFQDRWTGDFNGDFSDFPDNDTISE